MGNTVVGKACRRCKETLEATRRNRGGGRRHVSRRLCTVCYEEARRAGELHLYPRLQRDRDELMAEYAERRARRPRPTITEIAAELDMPRSTLTNALRRAAAAGDSRSDFGQQPEAAIPHPRAAEPASVQHQGAS